MLFTPRVAVTGSTGFVGHWLKRTIPPGIEYIGLGHDAYNNGFLEWLVDLTHIVHLAPVPPNEAIKAARAHNARLLYCSSGIVYYSDVDTRYRHDKIAGEQECLSSNINCVIARLFTFFGERQNSDKAIVQMFAAAREGRPLTVYRNVVRSYMHGAEMGRQLWKILFDGKSGTAYDVGSRRPVTLERVAKRIQAFTGCGINYVDQPVPMPSYYPKGGADGIMD